MARLLLTLLTVTVALVAIAWHLVFRPVLSLLGMGRTLEPVGNAHCVPVAALEACEKIVLHQPTGLLYAACSTLHGRTQWMPALLNLNASGRSQHDYVAVYDHKTSTVRRLTLSGFDSPRGLSVHGMDVVPSSVNPSELFVYLVNHRTPLGDQDPELVGADSSIEIFKTTVGGSTLTHLKTVEDPLILTPNDIAGSSDGKSLHFTNDHGTKTGFSRKFELLGYAIASVGYCHVDEGCKFAITKLSKCNGIARGRNDTYYIGNDFGGQVHVLEKQSDNTLVLTDVVQLDRALDNLSVDAEGVVWAAAFPNALSCLTDHWKNPAISCPSSALRITRNSGQSAFFGEKFKVEKAFEDDGGVASGITSVAYDSQRSLLYLSGLASRLTVCSI